jgi:hypothetical protein
MNELVLNFAETSFRMKYIISTLPKKEGYLEVHAYCCLLAPGNEFQKELGNFENFKIAMEKASKNKGPVKACTFCSPGLSH